MWSLLQSCQCILAQRVCIHMEVQKTPDHCLLTLSCAIDPGPVNGALAVLLVSTVLSVCGGPVGVPVSASVHGDTRRRMSYGSRSNANHQDSSYRSVLTFREHCDDGGGKVSLVLESFDCHCMRRLPAGLSMSFGRLPCAVNSGFVFLTLHQVLYDSNCLQRRHPRS